MVSEISPSRGDDSIKLIASYNEILYTNIILQINEKKCQFVKNITYKEREYMSKTINFLNKVAFAIVTILVLISTATVVRAEEDNIDLSGLKKELVLYNADGDIDGDGVEDLWVGFRYDSDDYDYYLEVTYNGKTLSSLLDEGYIIEYRAFAQSISGVSWGDWIDLKNTDIKNNIIDLSDFLSVCEFKIFSDTGNLISSSDRIICSPVYITFPIDISTKPYIYDSNNLDGQSIKFSVKYNDCLNLIDANKSASINMEFMYGDGIIDDKVPFFPTNLEYTNYSENITIDGENYTWNYSIITFYCNLAHCDLTNTDYDSSKIGYSFTLQNLIGTYYNVEPCEFTFRSISYKDTSLNPQKKLVINNHENRLEVDETTQLSTKVLSDEISTDGLMWVSSDDNIAKVDENGVVTATGLGRAYIYATKEDTIELYDYCIVDVVENIPISNISLDVSTLALKTGEEHQFIPTVEPENALDRTVTWTSSDETIVAVNENGLVTAKSAGTAVITATSNYDKSISISCTVTVTDPISKVKSITITGIPKVIKYNSSFRLTAIIAPSDAMNNKITWKSSNTKYAAIDSRGNVTIKSAGAGKSVKITAKAQDGSGVSKTVTLKIRSNTVKVTKLKIKSSKTKITAGKSVKLKVAITPSNAANKKVTWKSSNTKYATVNSKGVVVTKKAGKGKTVKITAISKDNSKVKATVIIKIKK